MLEIPQRKRQFMHMIIVKRLSARSGDRVPMMMLMLQRTPAAANWPSWLCIKHTHTHKLYTPILAPFAWHSTNRLANMYTCVYTLEYVADGRLCVRAPTVTHSRKKIRSLSANRWEASNYRSAASSYLRGTCFKALDALLIYSLLCISPI